jgi:acylphosphatase
MPSQVEGEAQGDESSVQKLLKDVDRGPRLAHVVKLEKSEIESKEGEINFSILR